MTLTPAMLAALANPSGASRATLRALASRGLASLVWTEHTYRARQGSVFGAPYITKTQTDCTATINDKGREALQKAHEDMSTGIPRQHGRRKPLPQTARTLTRCIMRLPPETLAVLDKMAFEHHESRSEAVERLAAVVDASWTAKALIPPPIEKLIDSLANMSGESPATYLANLIADKANDVGILPEGF